MAKATDGVLRAPNPTHRAVGLDRSRHWALSPSDLVFLWEECPRCFYKKVVLGQARPRAQFPKIFGVIDRAMKAFTVGKRAEELAPGAPVGVIGSADRWVRSAPISLPGRTRPLVLRGRLDALVTGADGAVAVVDFKTALPKDLHLPLYSRQLHAYAWALERPQKGTPIPVDALGLLYFNPQVFEVTGPTAALQGALQWIEVPRDDVAFAAFLAEVSSVLERPGPPPASSDCPWCQTESACVAR